MPIRSVVAAVFFVSVAGAGPGQAQPVTVPTPAERSLDVRLLYGIYRIEQPVFTSVMRGADATAYPVYAAAAPAAWGATWLFAEGDDWSAAYRLTLSELSAGVGFFLIKQLIRRDRPFRRFDAIERRDEDEGKLDRFSFPSGHTTLAFSIATSLSLSYSRWYVIAPSALWASSVALSRVWLGVHYPSDIVVGALLGSALATGVHLLGSRITPNGFEGDTEAQAPFVTLRIGL